MAAAVWVLSLAWELPHAVGLAKQKQNKSENKSSWKSGKSVGDFKWRGATHGQAAAALIQPPAWELPYAAGTALKSEKIKSYFFKKLLL